MLVKLLLPTILSAVALFFASFLSWMVVMLHKKDWLKLDKEDEVIEALRSHGVANGNYMFPGWETPEEMKSEEYAKKMEAGPAGVMTLFGKVNMGRNLGLTFLYFLVCSFCLAYLASLGVQPGDKFMAFRFVATAGLMTFLSAIVQHAIWFHNRIVGHVIESIVYALIVGGIFAAFWPGA
jgi:hypothetical protein